MTREEFERVVAQELPEAVPEKFRNKLKNVAFLVSEEPSAEVREAEGLGSGDTLLGYYRGVPHTARGDMYGVGPTLPDVIFIYHKPIEDVALSEGKSIEQVVRETIWHEVFHHFGADEATVRRKEDERDTL